MGLRLIAFLLLLLTALPAQAEERKYQVTFTSAEINYVASVLRKQPYDDVAAILESMQRQVNEQNVKPLAPVKPVVPEP